MNEDIKGIRPLIGRVTGPETQPPQTEEAGDDLFMELFQPSIGEFTAQEIIVGRDPYTQPKPSQALIDLVESIVARFSSGEWQEAEELPEGATSPTGSADGEADGEPTGITFIKKQPEPIRREGESIEELYHEGTLLYALYPPPEEEQQDRHERFKGEGYLIAKAVDAFLEHATDEEKQGFLALYWERKR